MTEEKTVCEKNLKCGESTVQKYGLGVRHLQMVCMFQCMMTLFIGRSSLGVAILAMTDVTRKNDTNVEIYEWDKKTQGIVLSSFFWGYMTMQIPAGIMAKKYGGKLIMLVALLANGFLCLILPFLASFGGWMMVCACRTMMGLTQACLFPASHTLLGRWLPASERTALTGLVYGGSQIGTIIAMPVSGLLAETAMGWKLIFYSISGLMIFNAVVWYWFAASSPSEHRLISQEEREYIQMELCSSASKVERSPPWKAMLRTVPLWAIIIAHGGSAYSFTLYFVDLPAYLEKAMHISLKNSAFLSALPYIGMWIGGVISSNICERLYNNGLLSAIKCRKIFNSIALFGTGLGLVAVAFLNEEQKTFAIVTLVLTLTLYGFITPGYMVNHLDLSPQFGGVMLSLTNFAASLSSLIAPVVTGLVLQNNTSDVTRWRIVFLIAAAIIGCSNIVYLIFGSATRQPWDSDDYEDRKIANLDEIAVFVKKEEKEKEANNETDNVNK